MKDFAIIDVMFNSNINAVRIFSKKIGGFAEMHDQSTFLELKQRVENLMEINLDELAAKDAKTREEENGDNGNDDNLSNVQLKPDELISNPEVKDKVMISGKWLAENPDKLRQFFELFDSFDKQSSGQSELLQRSALITLVSYFELLLVELLREFYFRYPFALPSDDRVLSLEDIRSLGTIEEAEKYLIMKEADNVIRKNTQEQLVYFEKRLNIDLDPIQEYVNNLIEIVQRRNLITHNDGIVDRLYLTQVSKDIIKSNKIKYNQQLFVTESYLSQAIDTIYTVGIILIQQCWRKWERENRKKSDSLLLLHIYNYLFDANYELTIKLSLFASKIKLLDDYNLRIVTINHAIALKELGHINEMEKLLEQLDWSSCANKFDLALSVLRNDDEKIYKILPNVIAAKEIERIDMEEWPLFRKLRDTQRFREAIDSHFPKS